jgi:TRAP transporter TAXI family solute receptor
MAKRTKNCITALAIMLAIGIGATSLAAQDIVQSLDDTPYNPNSVPKMTEDGAEFTIRLSDPRRPPEWFLGIYSGTTLGTYYYVATGLCNLMQATFEEHRIHCTPLRSSGVGDNIQLMNAGQAQSVMVQSDTNYNAATGERPMPQARSGLSLHAETGVMVVSQSSGIESLLDLAGKRVNLGADGSTTQELWMELLNINDIRVDSLGEVFRSTQDNNVRALCDGSIDAFGTWIGHPSILVASAVERCGARVVGMSGNGTTRLVNEKDYFFEQNIPAGTYANQTKDVVSYGITASLLFHKDVPDYITCHIAKMVVNNIEFLRAQHPALTNIGAKFAVEEGQFLELHPGIKAYNATGECPPVPTDWERLPDFESEFIGDLNIQMPEEYR